MRFGISQAMITVIRPGTDESFRKFDGNFTKFNSPTVLCISRFRPYKGLQFATRAMRYVLDQVPDARLIIAGNGDESYLHRELSGVDYRDAITFLRRTPVRWNEEESITQWCPPCLGHFSQRGLWNSGHRGKRLWHSSCRLEESWTEGFEH